MSTTNLFVELIVIGVGAVTWLLLFVFSLFGYAWVPTEYVLSAIAAIPALAVVYVLGIISDRLADALFGLIWSDDLINPYFKDRKEYYNARRIILTRSERLSDLLEYGRSRLRICRGWAFNSILISIGLNFFIWTNFSGSSFTLTVSVFGTIFLLLIALGAWFAWRNLTQNEYRKIKEQAAFIADPN